MLCKPAAFAASTSHATCKPERPDIFIEVVPAALLEPDWVLDGNDVGLPSSRASHAAALVAELATSKLDPLLLPDCDVIGFDVDPDTALEPDRVGIFKDEALAVPERDGKVSDEAPPVPERDLAFIDEVDIDPLPACSLEPDLLDELSYFSSSPDLRSVGTASSLGARSRRRQH